MRKVLVGAPQLDPADIKKCNASLRLLNSFLSEADYLVGDEITMVDYSAAASIAGCQVCTGGLCFGFCSVLLVYQGCPIS